MPLLDHIDSPADLRKLSIGDLTRLAADIRQKILQVTSQHGGHVAPNLGVVELTIALHYVFNTPHDLVVWDVGHQCYAHKLITGRRERFRTLRQRGGIAGFPKRSESEYDVFDTGHSGNAISVSLGLAVGSSMADERRRCIAVIGDGSIVTGMAFEALNHAGALKQNLIVILNDNEMSIARSTGAMASYFNRVITGQMYNRIRDDVWTLLGHLPRDLGDRARVAARKVQEGLKNLVVPSLLFEELGFRYVGPVDGHSIPELISTLRRVAVLHGPVLVHVVTRKGRGYEPAIREPERFHGTGPYDLQTGRSLGPASSSFTAAFGEAICQIAARDRRIVAITAGMCVGTGLQQFRELFPDRYFDVGICEQHAVSLAAGLAQAGLRPVVAIYSTFLMRAIDQIVQDVCLQKLPVVFAVDRSGLVGEDGPTHHGIFDLAYLLMVPRMTIMAPRAEPLVAPMLELAIQREAGPVAIRYPRGGTSSNTPSSAAAIAFGSAEVLREGTDGCLVALGSMVLPAMDAAASLAEEGTEMTVLDARFAKPIDIDRLADLALRSPFMATIEEGCVSTGFGALVEQALRDRHCLPARFHRLGLPDLFLEHATRNELLETAGLSASQLATRLRLLLSDRNG